jgi:hypothetical protein
VCPFRCGQGKENVVFQGASFSRTGIQQIQRSRLRWLYVETKPPTITENDITTDSIGLPSGLSLSIFCTVSQ